VSRPKRRTSRSHHDGLRGVRIPAPPTRGNEKPRAHADGLSRQSQVSRPSSGQLAAEAVGCVSLETPDDSGLAADRALLPVLDGMVRLLSDEGLLQLEAMLRDSLTSPRASERRHEVLGLMGRLVRAGEGVIPRVADYQQAYIEARQVGEDWPSHSQLIRRYGGSWLAAVEASMRLELVGTGARVKSSYAHAHVGDYTPQEVGDAIQRCKAVLGTWPTEPEFERFCVVERTLAAMHGKPSPRAPSTKAWLKACGSWDAACEVARTLC